MSVAAAVTVLSVLIAVAFLYVYSTKMSAKEQPTTTPVEAPAPPAEGQEVDTTTAPTAAQAVETTAAPPSASATKNKANSYYYWHGHEKERAKVGDVAPMPTPHLVAKDDTATVAAPVVPALAVSKYSWCDGDKFVTVYVETTPPASGETLEEGTVDAVFTRNSFTLTFATVDAAGKKRTKRMVTRLSKRIDEERSSTKVKTKTQEILVKLAKRVPSVWIDLEGNASDRDSAADEPLEKATAEEDDE